MMGCIESFNSPRIAFLTLLLGPVFCPDHVDVPLM